MRGMCCQEPLYAILDRTPSIYAASTMQPPGTEPETEPSTRVAADSSRHFSSASNVDAVTGANPNENTLSVYEAALGDSFEPASGSFDAEQEFNNDFIPPPATVVATDHALRLRAMQHAIQELHLPLSAREDDESLLAIDEQLCLIECSITNAASALKTELQGGKLPEKASDVVDQQDASAVAAIPGEPEVAQQQSQVQQHDVGVFETCKLPEQASDVADQQHSSAAAAAAIPGEPEVAQQQPQMQQNVIGVILRQCSRASEATAEAV